MKKLCLALALFLTAFAAAPAAEYPRMGPDIYDPQADGSALIAAALAQAQARRQLVLLDFGANWCPWCHALHRTFADVPAITRELARDYVVVMIDVNQRHGSARNAAVNARYGNPVRFGLPVLVVLDAAGRPLVTQDTGALESGEGHDPVKVLAFLEKWAPAAR